MKKIKVESLLSNVKNSVEFSNPLDEVKLRICEYVVLFLKDKSITNISKASSDFSVNRSRLSDLVNYRIADYSIDRLFTIALSLGCNMKLKVE